MSKKPKAPFFFRVLPKVFPIYELLMPKKADEFIVKMFLTPLNFKIPEAETTFKIQANLGSYKFKGEELMTFQWGNPNGKTVFFIHGWAGRATQYRKFIAPLAEQGYNVIGIEGPGHRHAQKKMSNVLEFAECISSFLKDKEVFASIGHSLGGIALLLATAEFNYKTEKLITISTPTIADDVIDIFRAKIGASKRAPKAIDDFVRQRTGKPFDYYSGAEIAKRIDPKQLKNHLIIHDENDREAPVSHAYEIHRTLEYSEIFTTQNLGHVRILKDDKVVTKTVNFINL
jgi:pimeloyl-ACP methyl ester carboxylesterase